ncbi:MAG: hypothetical protein AAGC55_24875, partial [Myxococcota bacterium]
TLGEIRSSILSRSGQGVQAQGHRLLVGVEALGPTVEHLAELEGLDAHKQAVALRLHALAGSGEDR